MSSNASNAPVSGPEAFKFIPNYARCTKCDKEDPMMSLVKCCGRCWAAQYCSKACQVADWPVHKPTCKNQNYILTIRLEHEKLREVVERTLSCPSSASFEDFDHALKIAFGWDARGKEEEYAFLVWNNFVPGTKAYEQNTEASKKHMLANSKEILFMTPETTIHAGLFKLRLIDAKNWREFDTPTAKAFNQLDWIKRFYCPNDLPSEVRTIGRILEDPRFKACQITYHYNLNVNWKHVIVSDGRTAPTKSFQCTHGTGLDFDQEVINKKFGVLPVKGVKKSPGVGYGLLDKNGKVVHF